MCCTPLSIKEASMATTQFTCAAGYEVWRPRQEAQEAERTLLRMNWVVVTDEDGNRQLRMCWRADRDTNRSA